MGLDFLRKGVKEVWGLGKLEKFNTVLLRQWCLRLHVDQGGFMVQSAGNKIRDRWWPN